MWTPQGAENLNDSAVPDHIGPQVKAWIGDAMKQADIVGAPPSGGIGCGENAPRNAENGSISNLRGNLWSCKRKPSASTACWVDAVAAQPGWEVIRGQAKHQRNTSAGTVGA